MSDAPLLAIQDTQTALTMPGTASERCTPYETFLEETDLRSGCWASKCATVQRVSRWSQIGRDTGDDAAIPSLEVWHPGGSIVEYCAVAKALLGGKSLCVCHARVRARKRSHVGICKPFMGRIARGELAGGDAERLPKGLVKRLYHLRGQAPACEAARDTP